MRDLAGKHVSMKTRCCVAGVAAALGSPAAGQAEPPLAPFNIVATAGVAAIPAPLTGRPGDPKEGGKVVAGRRLGNCLSCHQIDALREEEFHGDFGPSLDGVAGRWDTGTLRMIVVNAITQAAAKPDTGPSPITVPKARRFITRVASSAPTTMPTPNIASTVPTRGADRPRRRTA